MKKVSRLKPGGNLKWERMNANLNVLMSKIIQIRQQLILFKLALVGISFDINCLLNGIGM